MFPPIAETKESSSVKGRDIGLFITTFSYSLAQQLLGLLLNFDQLAKVECIKVSITNYKQHKG